MTPASDVGLLSTFLAAAFAGTCGLTWIVTRQLRRRAILDRPNDRSSHTVPTPRGGGWGVVPVILALWAALAALSPGGPGSGPPSAAAILGAAFLALLSWLDDLRDLAAGLRFAGQAAAVAAALALMPGDALVLQGIVPLPVDRLVTGMAWLWFVNLYNFMDGIDGISGVETACVCLGLVLVAAVAGGVPDGMALQASVLVGAALGFLVWNWHPARVFLGDVGSVPLGFLVGWLLIRAAAEGQWAAALILPLYYLADATWTLVSRLLRGERIWQAHRQHFYQRAVLGGLGHGGVSLRILACNLVLVALAVAAAAHPSPAFGWAALGASAVATAILMRSLSAAGRR
jgi:UDP-N-acetylmuramyl pentapeptide phosphotransferase/UDP-N-acetylglucosamine-1-phosphate transferase